MIRAVRNQSVIGSSSTLSALRASAESVRSFRDFIFLIRDLTDGVASTPWQLRVAHKKESAVSRVLSWAAIPLGCASPRSSSDLPGSPCGPHVTAFRPSASLFGLAPGGVCRAVGVAAPAVRSYRTISPLPAPLARRLGGIFLLHFPWTRVPQALPGTLALWSPDFPPCAKHTAAAWPTLSAHHTLLSAPTPACRLRCGAPGQYAPRAARLA
jgi:hypothetical protein